MDFFFFSCFFLQVCHLSLVVVSSFIYSFFFPLLIVPSFRTSHLVVHSATSPHTPFVFPELLLLLLLLLYYYCCYYYYFTFFFFLNYFRFLTISWLFILLHFISFHFYLFCTLYHTFSFLSFCTLTISPLLIPFFKPRQRKT
ncbi:hypothetical protein, unlikely [Trypanosoma brucei gambiense DAL972]|uniref:Uncharacterized protein n=1 Tax=Trypanosoma brucei gambiense (strain MHOM/CI/86/DAL972) TaxID=679716 RepID=C9ZLV1_TRYB9|nr:hypothetical protein, unlikely [Trypanosoma brucei gambiense DAL972]CBH10376.1 hypothetical protein, unlikely [Trypanosoma brucei gambiense DAL972]|eukprot:XP_011772666.1 hypothetical protein, unlikely [Trypanosoma brucei gambiense DAL972]